MNALEIPAEERDKYALKLKEANIPQIAKYLLFSREKERRAAIN